MVPPPSKTLVWNCAALSKVEGFGTGNWPASGCTRNECRGPPSRLHTAVAATKACPVQGLRIIMANCSKQQVSRIYPGLLRGCVRVRGGVPSDPKGVGKISELQPGQSWWVRKSGWPQALPAVLGSGEGGKRRKTARVRSWGARGPTEGELSQSGGRGSGRELLAWGHSEAEPRLLGDAPARTTPRGGARRGRAARRGAARPLGAPRRKAQLPPPGPVAARLRFKRSAGSNP